MSDPVNNPSHYNAHPDGMECIELVALLPFCEGNAIKYLWRAGKKGGVVEDLKKARWYVERAKKAPEFDLTDELSAASDRACKGFDILPAAAISLICLSDYILAARVIDAMIEAAEQSQAGEMRRAS